MNAKARLISLSLLLAVALLPHAAGAEQEPEAGVDLDGVRELRAQTEADASLAADLIARALGLYDAAIASLETADRHLADVARFDKERAGVGRLADALRADLSEPEEAPRLDLPGDATSEQAETRLARERSRLRAHRAALRDAERLVEERSAARDEASRRLGALDQELETIADGLREASQVGLHPALNRARRISLLARREASLREIDRLRAELALLDARGVLIPSQVELAQRRVAYDERLVEMLEAAAKEINLRDAQAGLEEVVNACREAAELSPALKDVAAETEQFAQMLWGTDGVVRKSEEAARALSATRKHLADLDRIVQLTRRQFDASGYRGSVTRWWPEVPEGFPEPGKIATDLRILEKTIPGVQHQVIRFEQQRSASRKLANQIVAELETDAGELDPELNQAALDLFSLRRDLLDQLIQHYGRYSDQLAEQEHTSEFFLGEVQQVESFLFEKLLWIRSVPRPVIPRVGDSLNALRWLTSGENWRAVFRTVSGTASEFPFAFAFSLFALGLLIGIRRSLRQRLTTIAEAGTIPFKATLECLVYTILLVAPLPLALYFASQILSQSDAPTFVFAMAETLGYLTSIAALFEVLRQTMAPHGLGEAHFGWPHRETRIVHRSLVWPEILFLPAIFVAIQFGSAGMRMDSPETLQAYNNSLGRIVFFVAMLGLGSAIVGLFRPHRRDDGATDGKPLNWAERAYLFIYPLVILGTIVPAILAILGFYITGYLLAYQMLRTLGLVMALSIAHRLVVRWQLTSRIGVEGTGTDKIDVAQDTAALQEADAQVRKLSHVVLVLIAIVGFYSIWSDAVPAAQMMKRVQLLPRLAIIEEERDDSLLPIVASGVAPAAQVTEGTEPAAAEPESGSTPAIPGLPKSTSPVSTAAGAEPESTLTLWDLVRFALALVITLLLVKYVPGVLELILRRRSRLDPGARVAVITLVRYAILIVGFTSAFSHLGISWSKIQWLAAALTFGLGFGLQEIVANFVSGLILLLERPVRVGDAVTIGNLQGRVSRIHIRATTITLWDRSEMIVPNKEFITTKLINWTLSDSKRRVDIPLRVSYDADLATVKKTLVEVARRNPDVLDDPPPVALLLEFGEDALKFELRYFVDFGQGLKTRDELHVAVDAAFREKGIAFALPQLNIKVPPGAQPNRPES